MRYSQSQRAGSRGCGEGLHREQGRGNGGVDRRRFGRERSGDWDWEERCKERLRGGRLRSKGVGHTWRWWASEKNDGGYLSEWMTRTRTDRPETRRDETV